MFLFNLYPFPIKQNNVLYSWLGLAALKHFGIDEICLLGNELQLIQPSKQIHGPWVKDFLNVDSYEFFDLAHVKVKKLCVPQEIIDSAVNEFESPIVFFNHYVKSGIQFYKNWLYSNIRDLHSYSQIEAIITPCNDKSIEEIAAWLNIPVIHMEAGAIRQPTFKLNTYCFDFKGVNGNTEANIRAVQGKNIFPEVALLTRKELLQNIISDETSNLLEAVPSNEFEIGIAMQVEDDSNVIVFNNEVSQLDILYRALRIFPASKILIRTHPLTHFTLTDTSIITGGLPCKFGFVDDSLSSLAFVKRCKRLLTLNSSVAIEAMLLHKPTWIFGESPLSFLASNLLDRHLMNGLIPSDIDEMLNWFVFCYYVPTEFWFDKEYIRWRLTQPDELDIYIKHKSIWDKHF